MGTTDTGKAKAEMADVVYESMLKALADYEEKMASKHADGDGRPCVHGDLCRQYLREGHGILRSGCPRCEFYVPKD